MAKQPDISISQTLHASQDSYVSQVSDASGNGDGDGQRGGSPRTRRLARLLASIAVLLMTAGAVAWVVRVDRGQTTARVTAEAQAAALRAADGIKSLLVAGVTTEVCVHTTVREANDRGYECLVLADCVGSYFPEFQRVGLAMIAAQGGIFGWVADSTAVPVVEEKP